jgi:hypothetical protein
MSERDSKADKTRALGLSEDSPHETQDDERGRLLDFLRAGLESVRSGRIVTRDEMRRRIDEAFAAEAEAEKRKRGSG